MTDINERIAEIMGIVPCDQWAPISGWCMVNDGEACGHEKCYPRQTPTQYDRYLDAMHEAEQWLEEQVNPILSSPSVVDMYQHCLTEVVLDHSCFDNGKLVLRHQDLYRLMHATAAQRAQAFVKVYDKQ